MQAEYKVQLLNKNLKEGNHMEYKVESTAAVRYVDKKVKQANHLEYKVLPEASLYHQEAICHLADLH